MKKDTLPPHNNKVLQSHFFFDVKYDLRHQFLFVAGEYLADPVQHSPYSGITSLQSVMLTLFSQ